MAVCVGTEAVPAGRWTGCVGDVGDSCSPSVFVLGPPALFVGVLISVTATTPTCTVAYKPVTAMV